MTTSKDVFDLRQDLIMMMMMMMLCIERPGIKDVSLIRRLSEVIDAALLHQLRQSYPPSSVADVRSHITERLTAGQRISTHHSELLATFKSMHPNIEFPALHKELFSQEGIDTNSATQS